MKKILAEAIGRVREAMSFVINWVTYDRVTAELFAALERGEGSTVFLWSWDGPDDYAGDVDELLDDIDEVVRRAPSPLGADEFFIRVATYGGRPQDVDGVETTHEGRQVLSSQSLFIDRYHDWRRGDAKERLLDVLRESVPRPTAPLMAVGIFPFGEALAAMLRTGRWHPASPWLR
jgi:hypothetical protein